MDVIEEKEVVKHWEYFPQKNFTRSQRSYTTILTGGTTFKHDRLIKAVLKSLGYKIELIPTPTVSDFQAGKEYGNYGQCNPTYFTVGALVNYLKKLEESGVSKEEINDNYLFLTASSACGPCRFGMYQNEYRLATTNAGFEGFRILTFQQKNGINQETLDSGLELNPHFFVNLLHAFNMGDLLNEISYAIRPYEVNEGETNKVLEKSLQYMEKILSELKPHQKANNKNMETLKVFYRNVFGEDLEILLNALEEVGRFFDEIEIDRTKIKPVVKITGEFWAQTTEGDGNFNMFAFLEREGSAVLVEPIATWINYLLFVASEKNKDRKNIVSHELNPSIIQKAKSKVKQLKGKLTLSIAEKTFTSLYHRMGKKLLDIPHHLIDQQTLADYATRFYNTRAAGGEGHLEVGKNIYYHEKGLCHMVLSLKPFGCMPSTQSDGTQAAVTGAYGDMIFLPIETSGEGEVNAHSRVQMALGEAKRKAKNEVKKALEDTSLSMDDVRAFIDSHPELKKPSYKVPQYKQTIGMAANTIYHIKERRG